jgi:hypothetical protein
MWRGWLRWGVTTVAKRLESAVVSNPLRDIYPVGTQKKLKSLYQVRDTIMLSSVLRAAAVPRVAVAVRAAAAVSAPTFAATATTKSVAPAAMGALRSMSTTNSATFDLTGSFEVSLA